MNTNPNIQKGSVTLTHYTKLCLPSHIANKKLHQNPIYELSRILTYFLINVRLIFSIRIMSFLIDARLQNQ